MKTALALWFVMVSLCFPQSGAFAADTPSSIPEVLVPWKGWVLKGYEEQLCPFPYNNQAQHFCVWPSDLKLNVSQQKALFVQKVVNYKEAWAVIPGDTDYWPQDVKVNSKPYPVSSNRGRPALLLPIGEYTVEGTLFWEHQPDFIQIPVNIGTINLLINDKAVEQPDRDRGGRLWLSRQSLQVTPQKEQDAMSIKVYRLFKDDIPLEQTMMMRLRVSGQPREVLIGPVLLPKSLPVRIDSALATRLEEDGMLRMQVKPGVWEVSIRSRFLGKQDKLDFAALPAPWPQEEIWSFQQQNEIRLVDVQGAQSIDPQQTDMPVTWREFPAYLMSKGKSLTIKEMRRGQEVRKAEQLSLQRRMWLDFSGKGYTLEDTMSGTVEQHWRLSQLPPYQLGRVTIDGQEKLITQVGNDLPGVEIRASNLNLLAVSRVNEKISKMPAVGWDVDVQSLSTQLHLPPGWMLLGAFGVDTADGAWVQQWTLLDLFLALVIAAAVFKLLGVSWGLIALVMIALTYQERAAPVYSWLNLLAALSLIVVLPATSRAKRWIIYYFRLSFVYLLIIALPFMAVQIRNAIYPQLTLPNGSPVTIQKGGFAMNRVESAPQVAMEALNAPLGKQKMLADRAMVAGAAGNMDSVAKEEKSLEDYDPNAKIQTGPSVPNWYWNQYTLSWNGPVGLSQTLRLCLLSSKVTSVLKVLQVLLMLALIYALFRASQRQANLNNSSPSSHNTPSRAMVSVLLLCGLCFGMVPSSSKAAEIPDANLLTQLRERLLEPPTCLPECAEISRMQVEAKDNTLTLRLKANVTSAVAIPIPSTLDKWVPRTVLVNNAVAKSLQYDSNQQLWLSLPAGVHDIVMEGLIGDQNKFEVGVPLKPKEVTQTASGWAIEGINRQKLQGNHLYFNRVKQNNEETKSSQSHLQAVRVPPFVILTKTLNLGLEWEVINQVQRIAPQQGAIEIRVPLLEGEAVLSDKVQVKEGKAWVTLGANENQVIWRSKLAQNKTIKLVAVDESSLKQVWQVNAISQWHLRFEGIPMIHQINPSNRFMPRFEPWNGEALTIEISKPQPIQGNTVTIDESRLAIAAGKRMSEGTLSFTVRASEGGAHVFKIPEAAVLQDVLINGMSQPINSKQGEITVPLNPGTQNIEVSWQQPHPIANIYKTPLVNLQMPSSNGVIDLSFSKDRWILLLGGPVVGPAVLFWGILAVILAAAIALGRSSLTPLRSWQWLLLAMGLTLATPMVMIIVVLWFVAMNKRRAVSTDLSISAFQWIQVGLVLLTFAFVVSLFTSISDGLLGTPSMQLSGPYVGIVQSQFNNPDNYKLQWYQDIAKGDLAQAWVISLPMYIYRVLMLLWALWLAFSLVKWLRWGWECFATQGYWKER